MIYIYHEASFSDMAVAEEANLERHQIGIPLDIAACLRRPCGRRGYVLDQLELRRREASLEPLVPGVAAGRRTCDEVVPEEAEEAADDGQMDEASPLMVEASQRLAEASHGEVVVVEEEGRRPGPAINKRWGRRKRSVLLSLFVLSPLLFFNPAFSIYYPLLLR